MYGIFTGAQEMSGILLVAFETEQEAEDYLDTFYKKMGVEPNDFWFEGFGNKVSLNPEQYDEEDIKDWEEGKSVEEIQKGNSIREGFEMFFPHWYFGCGEPSNPYVDKLPIGKPVMSGWSLD